MIRIAILDRHPAVRAGIDAILRTHHGLVPVGCAADRRELMTLVNRSRPDVVLVEHDPGTRDGLAVCLDLASRVLGPRVVLWTADAGTGIVVPATLAGAHAIVDRASNSRELVHAVRVVGGGQRVMPAIAPQLQARAAALLCPRDRAIFAMRLAGTAPADIATTVGLTRREVAGRTRRIVGLLGAAAGSDGPGAGPVPAVGPGDAPTLAVTRGLVA